MGPSINNVFNKSGLYFSQYCQCFTNLLLLSWGPVAGENTHLRNATNPFLRKISRHLQWRTTKSILIQSLYDNLLICSGGGVPSR